MVRWKRKTESVFIHFDNITGSGLGPVIPAAQVGRTNLQIPKPAAHRGTQQDLFCNTLSRTLESEKKRGKNPEEVGLVKSS